MWSKKEGCPMINVFVKQVVKEFLPAFFQTKWKSYELLRNFCIRFYVWCSALIRYSVFYGKNTDRCSAFIGVIELIDGNYHNCAFYFEPTGIICYVCALLLNKWQMCPYSLLTWQLSQLLLVCKIKTCFILSK